MNKKYQVFRETLKQVIQNSGLDIGVAYFILKDVFSEIKTLYYAQLNKECLEEAKKINTNSKNNNRKQNIQTK